MSFHGTPLTISWLLLADLAIITASLRWHKYSFYAHTFVGTLIIGLTFGATISYIQYGPLIVEGQAQILNMHQVIGFMATVWMCFQFVTGMLTRMIQYSKRIPPKVCLWIKRFHNISGYIVMILSKFNFLCINFQPGQYTVQNFVLLLIGYIVLITIYIILKFKYWTLSQQIIDPQIKSKQTEKQHKKIYKEKLSGSTEASSSNRNSFINQQNISKNSIKELPDSKITVPKIKKIQILYQSQSQIKLTKYILFKDFVYDIEDFQQMHPGGQYVIRIIKKRQVNRFLYGSYTAQITPELKKHSHTKDSMRLIGDPIGKVQRSIPVRGMQNYNKVILEKKHPIFENSSTCLIYLKLFQPHNHTRFLGFESQSSIGQYFSLTISDKRGWNRVTRLYTTIWCMRQQNLILMSRIIPQFKYKSASKNTHFNDNSIQMKSIYQNDNIPIENIKSLNIRSQIDNGLLIPLVMKKYEKGELTPRFLSDNFNGEIVLSKPMGGGMNYQTLQDNGKIVIVCGGTGLLPFCDFIDLMFKRVKYLEKEQQQFDEELIISDPLITKDLIKNRQFKLYCAAQTQLDLLPLSLTQTNHLIGSKHIKFTAIFRIKKVSEQFSCLYKNFQYQKGYFNQNILKDFTSGNVIKLYICGSPQMNSSIGKMLKQNRIQQDQYHFM